MVTHSLNYNIDPFVDVIFPGPRPPHQPSYFGNQPGSNPVGAPQYPPREPGYTPGAPARQDPDAMQQ